jgi:gag-polypeptide of LTR copia-type
MSHIALKREFTLCCLTYSGLDPDISIKERERIRRRLASLGHLISDVDLAIHLLNNLPEEYKNLHENLESEIETRRIVGRNRRKKRLRRPVRS